MTATDELRRLLDERGVEWRDTGKRLVVGNGLRIPTQTEYEQSCGGRWSTVTEALSGTLSVNNLTPEQAIAATLGSKPDEIELTQTYDAGFRNGVMAVFQQLEGIESYEELQDLIAEYWGEGEGNDER